MRYLIVLLACSSSLYASDKYRSFVNSQPRRVIQNVVHQPSVMVHNAIPQPPVYIQQTEPIVYFNKKTEVKFRSLRLTPQSTQAALQARRDQQAIQLANNAAFQQQWQLVTSAIPIPPSPSKADLFKRFSFKQNMPQYSGAPAQIKDAGYQRIMNIQQQRTYNGMIDYSLTVEPNGFVNLGNGHNSHPHHR